MKEQTFFGRIDFIFVKGSQTVSVLPVPIGTMIFSVICVNGVQTRHPIYLSRIKSGEKLSLTIEFPQLECVCSISLGQLMDISGN